MSITTKVEVKSAHHIFEIEVPFGGGDPIIRIHATDCDPAADAIAFVIEEDDLANLGAAFHHAHAIAAD
jgi:hypothetical protein